MATLRRQIREIDELLNAARLRRAALLGFGVRNTALGTIEAYTNKLLERRLELSAAINEQFDHMFDCSE